MSLFGTYLIRPIRSSDARNLLTLIQKSSGGLSSLQPRLEFLQEYIESSEASFAGNIDIDTPHKYLLAMFDGERLIGCAAVKTQIGTGTPFINFDLKGDGLDQYLEASARFTGATEVGSLFLDSDYRASGLGRYLAKARYLLMASEPWRFSETVIAELRGDCGEEGSPLYDHLFKDRLEMDFLEADAEFFDRNPDTIGDIVPLGRISTQAMPLAVQASIGQPHISGVSAMRLLQSEGFIFSGTIDLFDAGPIMSVSRDTIRTIMNSRSSVVSASPASTSGVPTLISLGGVQDFRAVVSKAKSTENGLLVHTDALQSLNVGDGQDVRFWQGKLKTVRRDIDNTAKAISG